MAVQLAKFGAWLVRGTRVFDRAYQRADRLRSLLVLAFASDAFLVAYSRLAYGRATTFKAGSQDFRQGLFAWEERAIRDWFPTAPARILVGAAGGGREALALVGAGYSVVAFEPVVSLARSLREQADTLPAGSLAAFRASYEDLPTVVDSNASQRIDLRSLAPFDAVVGGWASFSHLISDEARVELLRQFGALTRGPILISYFAPPLGSDRNDRRAGMLGALKHRASRRGAAAFTMGIGFARLLSEADLRTLVDRAGLEVAYVDRDSTWPNAVLRAPTV